MSNVNEKNLVLTRAQAAVISRDFATAARLYKQLLKDDPSNVDYLKEIGAIYVKAGEDEKAVPYYEQIITFYPHYIDAMNSLGAIFRRLKRYEDSINILQKAVDEGRQSASVNYNLGFTYKEMKNYDDAIDAFESVIGENPSDVLAHNHLGCIYLEKKQYQKSISAFKRGLQIDQNHPILNYNLACCYRDAKQYTDAIRYYEAALRVKPGWIDAIKDYSNLLIKCQKTQEASNLVKKSIELHPNDGKLLSILGKIYLEQFDYEAAAKTFKRANSVEEDNVAILSGLAEALEKSDKPYEALEAVCKAVEIAPDDKDVKKQYVHTLLSAEDFDSAQVNVQDLYSNDGQSDPQVLDLYGQYCICVDDEVKAGEYFDQINQVNRQYKEHLLSAASRYNQKGNYVQAERFAKDYVAKNIQNPAGYNMLGAIYSKQGNVEGAIESYNKSQNLKKPNVLAEKQIAMLENQIAKKEEELLKQSEMAETPAEETPFYEPQIETSVEEQKEEEQFDFGSMGDNVPMGEALLEEENDFFDDLDKELENEPEEDFFEEEEPETPETASFADGSVPSDGAASEGSGAKDSGSEGAGSESSGTSSDPMEKSVRGDSDNGKSDAADDFDFSDADDISPFQDFDQQEPKSTAEQLVPDADFSDDDDFDYTSPAASSEPVAEESGDEIDPFDIASGGYDGSDDEEPVNNASSNQGNQNSNGSQNSNPNGNSGNSSGENGNTESAGNNSTDLPQDNQSSYPNLPEDDFSASDMLNGIDGNDNFDFGQFDDSTYSEPEPAAYESSMPQSSVPSNSQAAPQKQIPDQPQKNEPYSSTPHQTQPYPDYQAQSLFAREMEQRAREAAQESARYAMDAAMEAKVLAKQLQDEHAALKEKLDSLDNDYRNYKSVAPEYVAPEPDDSSEAAVKEDLYVPEETSESVVKEPVKNEINPEADTDFYDRDFGNFSEDENFVNDVSPETEEAFAFDDEIDSIYDDEIPDENSEDIPEIDSTYETETLSPASLVSPMGNEGYEEEIAEEKDETTSEIELFKKLRSLCDFVPDSERLSNNFGNMKTRIEYIISKMSGKQGLLKTAEEYVSAEVLEAIQNELSYSSEEDLDKYLLIEVLEIMKSLALSLEDQSVAATLCTKADELIDKVQEDQF